MASPRQSSQSIRGALSRAVTPRYVCRSCQQHLLSPNVQPMRRASNLSSIRRLRSKPWSTGLSSCSKASYASKSPRDYIHPDREQPKEENWADEERYEEATSWVGLETVGHTGHWKDMAAKQQDEYVPFIQGRSEAKVDRSYFLTKIYTAILDVLANKKLGRPSGDLYTRGPELRVREAAASLGLELSADGRLLGLRENARTLTEALDGQTSGSTTPTLMTEEELEQLPKLLEKQATGAPLTADEVALLSQHESLAEDEDSVTDTDSEVIYMDLEQEMAKVKLNFSDPITFEILKYFTTLSGHHIPDPVLSNVWNKNKPLTALADLLTQHFVHTKKKSVTEILHSKHEKALLATEAGSRTRNEAEEGATSEKKKKWKPLGPNVLVLARRETSVDKHKELGRWKVIERELVARGLPVFGKHKTATV